MSEPRGYHDIVRDALLRVVGGVVGERLTPGTALARPVAGDLVRVAVRSEGELRDVPAGEIHLIGDRRFELRGQTVPDPNSDLLVDYLPADAWSPINDVNVGGVARTLIETLAYELALFYQKLDRVYEDGFVDGAAGGALERLLTLVGVRRIRAGHPSVDMTFSRATPAAGDIVIPAGTVVSTGFREGAPEVRFETTDERVLTRGALEVTISARAVDGTGEAALALDPRSLVVMPRPVMGIDQVVNHARPVRGRAEETDDALRLRGSMALARAGRVTLEALRSAILDEGAAAVTLREMPRGVPGEVEAIIDLPGDGNPDDTRAQQDRVLRAIDTVRGAGLLVYTNFARKVHVSIETVRVILREGLAPSPSEKEQIRGTVQRAMKGFVASVGLGEAVTRSALVAAALSDPRVRDVAFEGVRTYQEDRLTRDPSSPDKPRSVDDTAIRLVDAAGVQAARLGPAVAFESIVTAPDERPLLELGRVELAIQAARTVHAVIVDVELRVVPLDRSLDREALRARVGAQVIEPIVRALFDALREGEGVAIAELRSRVANPTYTIEGAFLDALYVRDQRVLVAVADVPVGKDERAQLGELRVR